MIASLVRATHRLPRPNLPLSCALLVAASVLLMLARVVPLPGSLLGVTDEAFGYPVRAVARVVTFSLALVALFAAYVYALYSVRFSVVPRLGRIVLSFTALLCVPAILNADLYSTDVYLYIFYARMVNVHELNPYVVPPMHAPSNDVFLSYVDWRNMVSSYGPLWTTWSVFVDSLLPAVVWVHVVAFKIAAGLTHIINTLLIGAVVRRLSPRNTALAMAAYGWNPLPIMEFAGNAHNDSFMLMWVLAALLAYHARRPLLGALLLGAAVAAKFTAVLFLPFYVLALLRASGTRREKLRRTGAVGLLVGSVWVVAWLPYVGDGGWRRMYALPPQSAWYLNSLPAVAYNGLRNGIVEVWNELGTKAIAPVTAGDIADTLVRTLSLVLIIVVGARLGNRIHQRKDLVEMWFWFLFVYLCFVGPHFWPWYATMLVPLAAISRSRYILIATTVLCLSSMVMYSCANCASYFPGVSDSMITGVVIFALPLLALAMVVLRDNAHQPAGGDAVPELG